MFRDKSGRAVLEGDGQWGFQLVVDGQDLLVENVYATWFGGKDDKYDNGHTASGILNNQEGLQTPLGCALPIPGSSKTVGTPLPRLPWQTQVRVYNCQTGKTVVVPLIDIGPAKPPSANAALDLTQSAFGALGGNKVKGRIKVNYRVLGGAIYLTTDIKRSIGI
jgi:hypothetical protein